MVWLSECHVCTVTGDPVFCKLNNKAVSMLGCMGSANIWKDTVTYDELTINERQKSDPVYSKVLDEIRRGCPSEDSLNCLRDRTITVSVVESTSNYVNQEHILSVCSPLANNVKSTTLIC